MTWTRRRVLHAGATLAAFSAAAAVQSVRARESAGGAVGRGGGSTRRIALRNLHTGEQLETEYWRAAGYVSESLADIAVLLRDFRNGQQHPIDPKLMDYLVDVAHRLGVDPVFSVISGFRSPQTNERLRELSNGVARHSLHLEGRAIDVRIAGVDCAVLAGHALDLGCGGVGYYRRSDFVHLDTGTFRTWKG